MTTPNHSPSYVTRRCRLVEDGGCGRVLSATQFQRRRPSGARWGYHAKCSDCRSPYTPEPLEGARALYESAAPTGEVAAILGRSTEDAAYNAARNYDWSNDARKAARRALAVARKVKADGQCAAEGCYRPRTSGSDYCAGHDARSARPLPDTRRSRYGRASVPLSDVTVRCHGCGRHRRVDLREPDPCPRCGTSGALPVSAWDEAMADEEAA